MCVWPDLRSRMTEPRLIEGWERSPEQVKAMLDAGEDFVLLDCREQAEHAVARIEGATLLPLSQIRARLAELAEHEERTVVVFCHAGVRSMQVAAFLREQGFEDVWSMAGGIDAWATRIDPAVGRY